MRKLIAILLLLSASAFAQTEYFACSDGGNINAANKFGDTRSGTCACVGSATFATIPVTTNNDILNANGCATTITVNANPGDATHQAILRANATDTGAANAFTLATATCAGFTSGTLYADRQGNKTAALSVTGTTAGCILSGKSTGGSATSAAGTSDSHTTVAVTQTGLITGGTTASTANGYTFSGSSGSVDASASNAIGGTGAAGLNLSGNGSGSIKNCIGSDTSAGLEGCRVVTSSTSGLTVVGSLVNGKFNVAATGRIIFAPASTASAVYSQINTTYTSADIVDANGNILGSPTLTNAFVAPMAFVSSGIGTAANVKSGIVYGPYTGTAASGGNSGSAH